MKAIPILSFIFFVTFYATFISKWTMIYMMRRINGKEKGKKDINMRQNRMLVVVTSVLFSAIWVLQVFAREKISQSIGFFFENDIISYTGLLLTVVGMLAVNISMILMRTVCRVGGDKSVHTMLLMDGIYQYSRNPLFVGYDIMLMGVFLTFPNVLTLSGMLLQAYFIHKQILQEEKHFARIFGEGYEIYMDRSPRYIGRRKLL